MAENLNPDPNKWCIDTELPDDPNLAVEALEIGAYALRQHFMDSPPALDDPLSKKIADARRANMLRGDIEIIEMLRKNTSK